MRKIIFFIDHDMTIVDSLRIFFESYNNALRKFGFREVDFDFFRKEFCKDSLRAPEKINKTDFWEYFKKIYFTRDYKMLKPMPGARDFLSHLKKLGFPVIVVSGRGVEPRIIEAELKHLGLLDFVDEVRTLQGKGKGDFDKASLFIELKLSYGIEKCVVVGDYIEDMTSGRKAGCFNIGVTVGCKSAEKLYRYGADRVYVSLGELRRDLDGLLGMI